MKSIASKITGGKAGFVFTKDLNREDVPMLKEYWYKCEDTGVFFTPSLDNFKPEEWNKFYKYPEYFRYDKPSTISRRDERVYALISRVQERFGIKHPKILFHGNGASNAIFRLYLAGYDVYATYSFFDWDRSISVEEAQGMGDFDIVCGIEIIEHWADPIMEFDIVDSLLKKGGIFCGTTSLATNTEEMSGGWHALRQHSINAGHVTIWTEDAFDEICGKYYYENHTERGDKKMRSKSNMPATCVFFQFKK